MTIEDNLDSAKVEMLARFVPRLERVGEFVTEKAKEYAPKDLGALGASGKYEVFADELLTRISFGGDKVPYAAMQEFGGEISKSDGALTIPIHPDAVHHHAEDFTDLFKWVSPISGNIFLARKTGKGQIEVMFLLVKHVTIPADPYLRPAVENNLVEIEGMLSGH